MFKLADLLFYTKGILLRSGPESFRGVSVDTRTIKKGEVFFALKGRRDGHQFVGDALKKGASGVVISKEVPANGGFAVLVKDTLKALGDFARGIRERKNSVFIGITGSAGKTTTKQVLGEILSFFHPTYSSPGNYNNLIGLPLSILEMKDERFGVFELGISLLGEMEDLASILQPDISFITSIGPSHIEGLGSLEAVLREKLKLVEFTKGAVFLEESIPYQGKAFRYGKSGIMGYPLEDLHFFFGGSTFRFMGKRFRVNLPGYGGLCAALSGIALALHLDLSLDAVRDVIESLSPLPGRGKRIEAGGVIIIDDTYNSNPLSLEASLRDLALYPGRKIAVIGDMLELGRKEKPLHERIGRLLKEINIDRVFLFGKRARWIGDYPWTEDMEELIAMVGRELKKGDAVLVKGSRGMKMERLVEALL